MYIYWGVYISWISLSVQVFREVMSGVVEPSATPLGGDTASEVHFATLYIPIYLSVLQLSLFHRASLLD